MIQKDSLDFVLLTPADCERPVFFHSAVTSMNSSVNPGSADIHLRGFKQLEMIKLQSAAKFCHQWIIPG